MMFTSNHGCAARLLASVAIAAIVVTLSPVTGGLLRSTPAHAQVAVSIEFRPALEPYGRWQPHPRWGEVWIPDGVSRDWRPYTNGHWIYTDDWGWYWVANDDEDDWGWITYHYGRWVFDRDFGWVWVQGDEWGPAWVDWRRGPEYVGWAPLPPDDVIVEYREDPTYWTFLRPRNLLALSLGSVILQPRQREVVIRQTVVVNRTIVLGDRGRSTATWLAHRHKKLIA